MILAAHHPGYLPSLPFFSKLAAADVFVLADDYQYTTHNRINRTQIKTADGARWLSVPVLTKGRGRQKTNEVRTNGDLNWTQKHLRALEVNYCYAAYFEQYVDSLAAVYARKWQLLVDLNLELITVLCSALEISTAVQLSSDLGLSGTGNARLFDMLAQTGCDTYLTDPALIGHLKPQSFEEQHLVLKFLNATEPEYHQQFGDFTPGLSVVDLLFNEGAESRNILLGGNVVSATTSGS